MAPMTDPTGRWTTLHVVIVAAAAVALLGVGWLVATTSRADNSRGLESFSKIATVLQHPRCTNCHHSSQPRIRDDSRKHIPSVRSGNDGTGVGGGRCRICHRQENNKLTRIPGRKGWRMPPYSMSWDGLSAADICDNIKDQSMNGGRDLAALKHHFIHDELVKWAWDPGANRTPPPIAYDDFINHVSVWIDNGAPCPASTDE